MTALRNSSEMITREKKRKKRKKNGREARHSGRLRRKVVNQIRDAVYSRSTVLCRGIVFEDPQTTFSYCITAGWIASSNVLELRQR